MSNTSLIIFLLAYIFVCLFGMYFFLLADPDDSPIAYFVQVTIPFQAWSKMTQVLGSDRMGIVKIILDRALVMVYFVVVGGSWSVVFWYLYPWLLFESPGVSNIHAPIGVIVFILCFVSWGLANSSRPGKITAQSFKRYDHYPYDNLLFVPNRRCDTTRLPKIPRSKFDRLKYDCIVPRYDHFCGWTYNTYGEENYRWFLLFLAQHVFMCFYGSYVTALLFYDEIQRKKLYEISFFDRATGETVQSSTFIIFQYFFARRTLECCVLTIMFVMGIALTWFLSYHVYLTSTGQTTNENAKWGDVKQWYKKEQKRYQQAVKDGKVVKGDTTTEKTSTANVEVPTPNDDGDVTCTPSVVGGSSSLSGVNDPSNDSTTAGTQQPQQPPPVKEEYIDPGPIPKNIYDRGLVENWKEVFFPISLRKDALARGGYTKPRGPPPPSKRQQPQVTPPPEPVEVVSNKTKST